MIRSILFDFGGTLDTNGIHWSEKFWEVYQRVGVDLAKSDYELAFVSGEARMPEASIDSECSFLEMLKTQVSLQFSYLSKSGALKQDDWRISDLIAEECHRDVSRTILLSRIVLDMLAKTHRLGLISNFYGNLASVCDELGISCHFKVLIDSTSVGISKPDPRFFDFALQKLQTNAAECLMVGDSYDRDIIPVKLLGCTTIWLHGRSWKEPENTEMADYTITSISQLPQLISKISLLEKA